MLYPVEFSQFWTMHLLIFSSLGLSCSVQMYLWLLIKELQVSCFCMRMGMLWAFWLAIKSLTSLRLYYLNTGLETIGEIPKHPTPRLMVSLKCVNTLNSIFPFPMTQTKLYLKEATKLRQTENTEHRRHIKNQLIIFPSFLSYRIKAWRAERADLLLFAVNEWTPVI